MPAEDVASQYSGSWLLTPDFLIPMKDTFRTFVAVEVGDSVRRRAGELMKALDAAGADVKWVERHNLHLTLKFLDEVPSREIPQVCEAVTGAVAGLTAFDLAVTGAVAGLTAFDLEIRGCGAFPHVGRPRTVWLGSGVGEEAMATLQGRVENALAKLGYRKEGRRYQSHLTLGRVRSGGPAVAALGQLIRQHAEFDAGRFRVTDVVVFSSELGPKGPNYEALCRAELPDAGAGE
jgi:RNA 2',3'-cyclic 3'-phosphodiesterase